MKMNQSVLTNHGEIISNISTKERNVLKVEGRNQILIQHYFISELQQKDIDTIANMIDEVENKYFVDV
jgi:hypothetical protein